MQILRYKVAERNLDRAIHTTRETVRRPLRKVWRQCFDPIKRREADGVQCACGRKAGKSVCVSGCIDNLKFENNAQTHLISI